MAALAGDLPVPPSECKGSLRKYLCKSMWRVSKSVAQVTHKGAALRPLVIQGPKSYSLLGRKGAKRMGINSEQDIEANLQIGPTSLGMVRLFIEAKGVEIPMDFEPEEAEEIAEELCAAAAQARKLAK
tara:strand:- start:3873 stop:4256 length:384 start_codon:yes stop_codon:yes gene_type:complete